MGIMISIPPRRGCSRWRYGDGAINLAARPACAALAALLSGDTGRRVRVDGSSPHV